MNPLTLHLRNYRCFEQLDLQLPDGCVAILGENGAGKSSIVNAIDLTTFGARSLADQLSDQANSEELLLELDLEHAGELYRIRRTFSARGRGKTTLDFEQADPSASSIVGMGETWRPLTCASTKETQELIEATLGLSRETFRASAFLAQGDGAAFTDAQPRDRKRILAQVLGLDRYDRLQERARGERRSIEAELQASEGRTETARLLVESKPGLVLLHEQAGENVVELAAAVVEREQERDALTVRYQEAREQAARRLAAEAELAIARVELARLEGLAQQAVRMTRVIEEARAELAALGAPVDVAALELREAALLATLEEHAQQQRDREAVQREHDRLTRERDALVAQIQETDAFAEIVLAKITATEAAAAPTCETCGQHLADDAKAKALASYVDELERHRATRKALYVETRAIVIPEVPATLPEPAGAQEDLAAVRKQLAAERFHAATRATLEERIKQGQSILDAQPSASAIAPARIAVNAKELALAALGTAADPTAIEGELRYAADGLRTAQAALEQARTLKARLDERLAQLAESESLLVEAAADRKRLHRSLDIAVLLERAFGRDGIPALIVENAAIPYLEAEANRIVAELGTSYRVELRTQAELKSGDGLRDTLDVVVATENGERAYETFSGGERTRINLALRIALARLLAHRRGAESRLLAIDEPEFLDEHGTTALVNVLRGLQGDFDKLYIVSHVPGLRDSFDTTLSVVRDADGWSRVDEAGVFEVAA